MYCIINDVTLNNESKCLKFILLNSTSPSLSCPVVVKDFFLYLYIIKIVNTPALNPWLSSTIVGHLLRSCVSRTLSFSDRSTIHMGPSICSAMKYEQVPMQLRHHSQIPSLLLFNLFYLIISLCSSTGETRVIMYTIIINFCYF